MGFGFSMCMVFMTLATAEVLSVLKTEMQKIINGKSWRAASSKVTVDFKEGILLEPEFRVLPKILKVSNFYNGEYVEEKHIIENSEKAKKSKGKKKIEKHPFIKEVDVSVDQTRNISNTVTIDSIAEFIMEKTDLGQGETLGIISVVSSPGSGKTTLLRSLTGQLCRMSGITEENGFIPTEQSRFKLILSVELKNVRDMKVSDVPQFLFRGLAMDEYESTYEWLLKNQADFIIFFDGLDKANWSIDEASQAKIGPYERASTATIMYNILCRNLLSQARIVFSTREFKAAVLPLEARPQGIFKLAGFEKAEAKELFIAILGSKGPTAWKKIETEFPELLQLIATPVFLVLLAGIIAGRSEIAPLPKTVADVLEEAIQLLPSCEHIRDCNHFDSVLEKLKAVAYSQMKKGRVTFSIDSLKNFDLSFDEVQDLIIQVPGRTVLDHTLFESDSVLFFCHQSLQEFLCACYIAKLPVKNQKIIFRRHLHDESWSAVRRYLSGIELDKHSSLNRQIHRKKCPCL